MGLTEFLELWLAAIFLCLAAARRDTKLNNPSVYSDTSRLTIFTITIPLMMKLLYVLAAGCLFSAFSSKPPKPAPPVKKKNILIIFTDDQRYNTINALGNKEIITPTMDLLAKNGTSFTQTHIAGSLGSNVGTASRTMLMTGKSLFGIHKDGSVIPVTQKTYPQLFRENGYLTFATGKWHSDRASFNRSFEKGENIFFGEMHTTPFAPVLNHYDPTGAYNEPFTGQKFSSLYYADAAVNFLNEQKGKTRPFLLYVAFTSPHTPHTPPQDYGYRYDPEKLSLPANCMLQGSFLSEEDSDKLLPSPRTEEGIRRGTANYYAMISEVDKQMARIIEALKASGKYENTIIVFASDNGLAMGQHGLSGKQNLYDHSRRVPMIMSGPGIPKGKQTSQYCYLHDLFPTLCAVNGIKPPVKTEGKSQHLAFSKAPVKGRPELFSAYSNQQRSIKNNGFKLVVYNLNGTTQTQLFDLKKDPLEMNNLAGKATYAKKQAALYKLLDAEMIKQRDFCNLKKKGWGHPGKLEPKDLMRINP